MLNTWTMKLLWQLLFWLEKGQNGRSGSQKNLTNLLWNIKYLANCPCCSSSNAITDCCTKQWISRLFQGCCVHLCQSWILERLNFSFLSTRLVLMQPGDKIEKTVSIMATSPGTKLLMATFSHSSSPGIVSRTFHKVSVVTGWHWRVRPP